MNNQHRPAGRVLRNIRHGGQITGCPERRAMVRAEHEGGGLGSDAEIDLSH
jgi:hypothetical protein